jgi:hypothetical protein
VPWRSAATTPVARPISSVSSSEYVAIAIVAGVRSMIADATGVPSISERPRSPCARLT